MQTRINKALEFLRTKIKSNRLFPTYISPERQMCRLDIEVEEIFSTALIAEILPKFCVLKRQILDSLYHLAEQSIFFTFFSNANIYPPDTDTNSLIYSILLENGYDVKSLAEKVFERILRYRREDEVIQVWLSEDRKNQVDPIVSINAQVLGAFLGFEGTKANIDFIISHLRSGNYWNGTRYYHSPDTFLYFVVRLARVDDNFADLVYDDLKRAAVDRMQVSCYPLDLAQRIIVFKWLGINFDWELEKLLNLQKEDGALPFDALFHFGGKRGYFGNSCLPTAFFVKALSMV